MRKRNNPSAKRRKTGVGINLSLEVLDYFKALAEETGLPHQTNVDLYLLDGARSNARITRNWVL